MWCSGSYKHICLMGHGFESLWGYLCFFNLILARREMYVGMRMGFEWGGMRKEIGNGDRI
jgi:hypothetical protein